MHLVVSFVPRCTGSNEKTLGYKHLIGSERRTSIIHQGTDELLVQQDLIPVGEITSPAQKGTEHTNPLSSIYAYLIDVRRLGEPFIKGNTQITGGIDTLD